jgi:hypothetical protein
VQMGCGVALQGRAQGGGAARRPWWPARAWRGRGVHVAWHPCGRGDETGRGRGLDGRWPVGVLGLARSGMAGIVGHAAGELCSAVEGDRGGKRESRERNRGLT